MLKRAADLTRSRCFQNLVRTSGKCVDAVLSTKREKVLLRNLRNPRSFQLLRRSCAAIAVIVFVVWLLCSFWDVSDSQGRNSSFSLPDELVEDPAEEACEGRRVFMYDIPREFNLGVLERCFGQMVHWLNFCPHAVNNGFGQLLDFASSVPPNSSLFSEFFARRVSTSSFCTDIESKVWNKQAIRAFIMHDLDSRHSCVLDKGGSWFGTDAYMLEEIYHKRMLHYPCLTADPTLASAFFLPYYTGLGALEYLYGAKRAEAREHGRQLVQFLEQHPSMSPYWKRNGGHDHFMVAGRTGWDFGASPEDTGWGTGIFYHRELQNVTFLVLEGRGWRPDFEQAVPYPTSFHPPLIMRRRKKNQSGHDDAPNHLGKAELQEWIWKVRNSRRNSLFAFVGAQRAEMADSIRGMLYNQCLVSNQDRQGRHSGVSIPSARTTKNETEYWLPDHQLLRERKFSPVCTTLDCGKIKNCGHNPQPAVDIFMHSEFCLQPRGDTATRRSTFDSIVAGCIPVFFHADSAYTQYKWHLPPIPESYSVYIPEEDIREGKMVEQVLRGFSEEQVRKLRETLVSLLPRVIYMDLVDDDMTNSAGRCHGSRHGSPQEKELHWDSPPVPLDLQEDAFEQSVKGMLRKVRRRDTSRVE